MVERERSFQNDQLSLPSFLRLEYATTPTSLSLVLPEEDALTHSWKSTTRKELFLTGRHLARKGAEALGILLGPLLPDNEGVPRWPRELVGSIAHTAVQKDQHVVAVVAHSSTCHALGVDIELVKRTFRSDLTEQILAPEEYKEWGGSSMQDLLRLFSVKEGIYKALYPFERKYVGLRDAYVSRQPNGSFSVLFLREASQYNRWISSLVIRQIEEEGVILSLAWIPKP